MAKKDNEFDIASLRLGSQTTTASTVEKKTAVGYPGGLDYIRVNPDRDYRDTFLYLDDARNREGYLVHPDLEDELGGDVVHAEVALAANQHGEMFVWVVKHPSYDGEPYAESRFDALDRGRTEWVRLRKRQDRQGYDVLVAQGTFPDPVWTNETFDEILDEAFGGRIVTSLDHPIVKRLRGETV